MKILSLLCFLQIVAPHSGFAPMRQIERQMANHVDVVKNARSAILATKIFHGRGHDKELSMTTNNDMDSGSAYSLQLNEHDARGINASYGSGKVQHLSLNQGSSDPLQTDEHDASSVTDTIGVMNASGVVASQVKSVNYFISRECNYSCKFCFHTQKNVNKLSLEKAKEGLKMLREAGTEKINFAGGEPFMNDIMLGELCRYSHELGMAVSIISNGSLIKPYWMKLYGEYVDVLGVSIDSFNPEVNGQIGRGGDANNKHLERILKVRKMCEEHSITFKMNTVVCSLNWQEDMTEYVEKLKPKRWKCFQVLILKDENSGGPGELRDAKDLVISRDKFDSFVKRHEHFDVLIPEPNDVMQNSYLLLDEELRFLDCSGGGKVPSESILDVGVGAALQQAGFDVEEFHNRGGIYEWTRERK